MISILHDFLLIVISNEEKKTIFLQVDLQNFIRLLSDNNKQLKVKIDISDLYKRPKKTKIMFYHMNCKPLEGKAMSVDPIRFSIIFCKFRNI